jgi:hypothetical protein
MSGAAPQLPQYTFLAWCSAKAQGQLYLYSLRFSTKQQNKLIQYPQQ